MTRLATTTTFTRSAARAANVSKSYGAGDAAVHRARQRQRRPGGR